MYYKHFPTANKYFFANKYFVSDAFLSSGGFRVTAKTWKLPSIMSNFMLFARVGKYRCHYKRHIARLCAHVANTDVNTDAIFHDLSPKSLIMTSNFLICVLGRRGTLPSLKYVVVRPIAGWISVHIYGPLFSRQLKQGWVKIVTWLKQSITWLQLNSYAL